MFKKDQFKAHIKKGLYESGGENEADREKTIYRVYKSVKNVMRSKFFSVLFYIYIRSTQINSKRLKASV